MRQRDADAAPEASDRCRHTGLIDAHFSRRIGADEELALRQHLPGCPSCRRYYDRRLLLSSLDPGAPDAKSRLARGLGLRTPRPRAVRPALLSLAGAAAAALIAVVVWSRIEPPPDGFQARGGPVASEGVELLLYKVKKGARNVRVDREIVASDELAVAYRNGKKKKRLMVFGVDEQKNVYWYHPAWLDARKDPAGVMIEGSPGVHELPEAIAHGIKGSRVTIYGLFMDRRMTVKQVEAIIRRREAGGELPVAGADQRRISLTVRHAAPVKRGS